MKLVAYILGLCIILSVAASCNDNLNEVGSSILPGDDDMTVKTDTFFMKGSTFKIDSIYAWSTAGLLGNFENSLFGGIKSDYLTQFYVSEDAKFKSNREITIDSVNMIVRFVNYYGDTLAPMGLSVYKINKELPLNFYTNIDPTKYCDMNRLLGQQTYTIASTTKTVTSSTTSYRSLRAKLDTKLGEEFYEEYKRDTTLFSNSAKLSAFFPGAYLTSTFGVGSLLEAEDTALTIHYSYPDKTPITEKDSIQRDTVYTSTIVLLHTPEVLQLNSLRNTNEEALLNDNSSPKSLYIKSPAGVCAELKLPLMDIINKLGTNPKTSLNSVSWSLEGFTQKEDLLNVGLAKPTYLLLIEKDKMESFFKNKELVNDSTSTLLVRNAANNTYNFNSSITPYGITPLVNYYRNMKITEDPTFLLIPVTVTAKTVANRTRYNAYNYMKPITSIIRGDEKYMKLGIVYADFK